MSVLTSITVIQVGKPFPLVVLDQRDQRPFDVGPHLENKLIHPFCGERGCDEGDVECLAEGRDGVYRLLVVEAKYGVDTSRELGTNQEERERENHFNEAENRDGQLQRIKLHTWQRQVVCEWKRVKKSYRPPNVLVTFTHLHIHSVIYLTSSVTLCHTLP